MAYGLKENQCKVIIFNRTVEKARELAEEFGLEFGGGLEEIKKVKDYDILINTTSVGFTDINAVIVDEASLKENKVVMDVVPNRIETPLLKLAKNKKCKTVPGYKMLIRQAIFPLELFTGKKAPFEVMEKALLDNLKK